MRVAGPVCAVIAASGPTATMRSPAIAIAWAIVNAPSTVITLPLRSTRSAGPRPAVAGVAGFACACVMPLGLV